MTSQLPSPRCLILVASTVYSPHDELIPIIICQNKLFLLQITLDCGVLIKNNKKKKTKTKQNKKPEKSLMQKLICSPGLQSCFGSVFLNKPPIFSFGMGMYILCYFMMYAICTLIIRGVTIKRLP